MQKTEDEMEKLCEHLSQLMRRVEKQAKEFASQRYFFQVVNLCGAVLCGAVAIAYDDLGCCLVKQIPNSNTPTNGFLFWCHSCLHSGQLRTGNFVGHARPLT